MGYSIQEFIRNRPHTRIVCTLGPATASREQIRSLVQAGMSVARINTSHSDLNFHAQCIQNVRAVSRELGVPIGILADLPGPKYRLSPLSDTGVPVALGSQFTLLGEGSEPVNGAVPVLPSGIHHDVTTGDKIFIADGAIQMRVLQVSGASVECEVTVGGILESRKAVATPGRTSNLIYLTEETSNALEFAVQQQVDFIGLSYVRSRADVLKAREFIGGRSPHSQLIAKIELEEAVERLDEILEECDGVMVARGDLGVEVPIQRVPGIQKRIIQRANEIGKVVITATQMLESMISAPSPTRAEVTDIANAVLDGTDAIMLSAETSVGKYPVQAVEIMSQAAREAEKLLDRPWLARRRRDHIGGSVDETIAYSACWASARLDAVVILAFTESGATAGRVASYRPEAPIIAMYRDEVAGRRLSLRWGVIPLPAPRISSMQWMLHEGSKAALETGFAREGDVAVAVAGMPIGVPGHTNLLRVMRLPEPAPRFERDLIDDAVRSS